MKPTKKDTDSLHQTGVVKNDNKQNIKIMTINTKFNIGDKVYTLSTDYRLTEGTITGVNAHYYKSDSLLSWTSYDVEGMEKRDYEEPQLFSSKEELFKRVTEQKWEPEKKQ